MIHIHLYNCNCAFYTGDLPCEVSQSRQDNDGSGVQSMSVNHGDVNPGDEEDTNEAKRIFE